MENEPKFKIGDTVTFKDRKDCINKNGVVDQYFFGGDNFADTSVIIVKYLEYMPKQNCYRINVHLGSKSVLETYSMLESEFIEYDGSGIVTDNYKLW